jgi:segregation and condensation protein A
MSKNQERNFNFNVQSPQFCGPLDYLLHLIQQKEVDIFDFRLQAIMTQFLEDFSKREINENAEFVGTFASLHLWKSRALLPKHEQVLEETKEMEDSKFEIIHQLIEYCRFKEAGKELVQREKEQLAYFPRGSGIRPDPIKPFGIDHLSLEDLAFLFKDLLSKKELHKGIVEEEIYKVSDRILWIRSLVQTTKHLTFASLFSEEGSRIDWIVTFLGLLELMKTGEVKVYRERETAAIIVALQNS